MVFATAAFDYLDVGTYSGSESYNFRIVATAAITLTCNGGLKFADNSTTKNVSANTDTQVLFDGTTSGTLTISDPSKIKSLRYLTPNIGFNTKVLENAAIAQMHFVTGTIPTNLIVGDCKYIATGGGTFADRKTTFDIFMGQAGVTGTLEKLLELWLTNGATGDYTVKLSGTGVTLHNASISSTRYVRFATNSITVATDSNFSSVVASYNGTAWSYS